VAVAAALSCGPRILALDEPTSGQDHDQVERMMIALRGALAEGVLLFVTHDLGLALRHATRLVVMRDGRIVADGPPAPTLADPPPGVDLPLPPLARLCLDHGAAPDTAARLAARLERL
jgi:energy-coupling factor transporter ATP-binding protein EcfA2